MPANGFQHVLFILYQTIIFICYAMLFLTLSKLFKNFYNRDFFTNTNVSLLRKSGWFLLLPQIVITLMYWIFLFQIYPVKISVSYSTNNFKIISNYNMESGINWILVFLGLGMIVLSYIFKNGLKLKEEQDFTV
ncbi:MAG: DUF2975 domain-containing protein [Chitinophagaceae bacterium]